MMKGKFREVTKFSQSLPGNRKRLVSNLDLLTPSALNHGHWLKISSPSLFHPLLTFKVPMSNRKVFWGLGFQRIYRFQFFLFFLLPNYHRLHKVGFILSLGSLDEKINFRNIIKKNGLNVHLGGGRGGWGQWFLCLSALESNPDLALGPNLQ